MGEFLNDHFHSWRYFYAIKEAVKMTVNSLFLFAI